jgi:hypothetical protein
MLKAGFSDSAMRRTQTLSGYLDLNLAKLKLKTLSILIVPQHVTEMKM